MRQTFGWELCWGFWSAGSDERYEPKGTALAAGGKKADALGIVLRPFLALAERYDREKGRGSHKREENDSDEQIVHCKNHPIH